MRPVLKPGYAVIDGQCALHADPSGGTQGEAIPKVAARVATLLSWRLPTRRPTRIAGATCWVTRSSPRASRVTYFGAGTGSGCDRSTGSDFAAAGADSDTPRMDSAIPFSSAREDGNLKLVTRTSVNTTSVSP